MVVEMGIDNAIDVLLVEDDDESHARLIQRAFEKSSVMADIRCAHDLRSMNAELNSKWPDILWIICYPMAEAWTT